jgi:hypothetical protein
MQKMSNLILGLAEQVAQLPEKTSEGAAAACRACCLE